MTVTGTMTATPDYAAIKTKQNAAWASGDYARIGTTCDWRRERRPWTGQTPRCST
jgi:hypothetical protein